MGQTDTEGGTHWTERLTNIDIVGGWARQTQRGDALDGKNKNYLYGRWLGQTDKEGGTHWTERLTNMITRFRVEYIQQENLYGRMGGWMILSGNIATSWLHLASWNLPDSQLS